MQKLCIHCKQLMDPSCFHNRKTSKDNLYYICKSCVKIRNKLYRSQHKNRLAVYNKETYAKNKAAVAVRWQKYYQQKSTKINELKKKNREKEFVEFLNLFGNTCEHCGEKERDFLTVDHIHNNGRFKRESKGEILKLTEKVGLMEMKKHLRILCFNCNSGRSVKNPIKGNTIQEGPRSKICSTCHINKNESCFAISNNKHDRMGLRFECRECHSKRNRKLKEAAMNALGGFCKCCKQSDMDKLNVDHILEDGNIIRRNGNRSSSSLYRTVLKGDNDNLQVLCFNCNYSKHKNGSCIHSILINP